jgi:hypothetical protein
VTKPFRACRGHGARHAGPPRSIRPAFEFAADGGRAGLALGCAQAAASTSPSPAPGGARPLHWSCRAGRFRLDQQ